MNDTKTTTYWLCTETMYMKVSGKVTFVEGKKYEQLSIKDNMLLLKDEQGDDHFISETTREEKFKEVR